MEPVCMESTDLLTEAEEAVRSLLSPGGVAASHAVRTFQLDEFHDRTTPLADNEQLDLRIELGRTHLRPDEVRNLRTGSLVSLDGRIDEPVDIRAGGRLIGRGEVVVLDGKLGVRVVELTTGR